MHDVSYANDLQIDADKHWAGRKLSNIQ